MFSLGSSTNTYISLDASIEFAPQNIFNSLQQINNRLENMDGCLQTIDDHVQIGLAQTANLRVVSCNTQLQALLQLFPLQKTVGLVQLAVLLDYDTIHDQVAGYGRDLALPFINVMDGVGRQTFHIQFPPNGYVPLIGSTPPNFNSRLEAYRHLDILRMMVFYNETFDIDVQDDLPGRINKFRRFLCEF